MKKDRFIFCCLVTAFLMSGCVKDDGNYDYKDRSEVELGEVTGMEEFYSVNSLQRLQVTPSVERITRDEDYEYYWCVWGSGFNRTSNKDTIGREKQLDYVVNLKSGTYELVFQAKNKVTGISVYRKANMNVASIYSQGWFVTKTMDGKTEVDLVKKDGTLYPDILKAANGESLPGKALKTFYQSGMYWIQIDNPDGTVTKLNNEKVVYVMSENDMRVYNADDMKEYRRYENAFFEPPVTRKLQDAYLGVTGQFLMNNGKIHWIDLSGGISIFGFPMLGNYEVAPFNMGSMNMGMLVYDKLSCSFKDVPYSNTKMVDLKSDAGQVDCNNMNCDLIFMDEQAAYYGLTSGGMALLKAKDKEEYYASMLNMNWSSGKNPLVSLKKVADDCAVGKGKVFAPNNYNDVLYFSDGGNTVGMYNISSGIEKEGILTYPTTESVVFIRHISYTTYSAGDQMLECLAVMTNSTAGWKVYLYHFVGRTAEIEKPEYQFFSGKGEGKHVMFRGLNAQEIN